MQFGPIFKKWPNNDMEDLKLKKIKRYFIKKIKKGKRINS